MNGRGGCWRPVKPWRSAGEGSQRYRERRGSRGRSSVTGSKELQEGEKVGEGRIRRKGGGRKTTVSKEPRLREDLERLVEPVTRGDPESPLRWTSKSVRKLAKELQHLGHRVSHELVSELLHGLGYRLQVSRKTREGGKHPDRDGQFEHLNA